jgi:tetratricopeptide (TPR) repeat protein
MTERFERSSPSSGSESPTLAATIDPEAGAPTGSHEAVTELEPGRRVGRYVVSARIGAGGMGVVYSAHDEELDRTVALKVVRGGGGPKRLLRAQKRLQREARAMAALSHPNVVTVHDVLVDEDRLCVAMELVDGGSLREWCKTPRTPEEIVRVFIQAGRGLAAAHRAGLVHRDFKPDNVLVDKTGRARVSDFGLARSEPTASKEVSVDSDERTVAGVGTPAYMAPEQFARAPVAGAADQFAFCVALHEALCGTRPFAGTTAHEIAAAVTRGDRVAIPGGVIARPLRRAIDRGLRRDPVERWPSMDALVQALQHAIGGRPRWHFLLGAAGIGGLGLWLLLAPAAPACAEASTARVDAAWNDAVKAERRERYAAADGARPEAFTDVAQVVDAWVASWQDAKVQLCGDAAQLEAHRDAGLQCLRERAAVLERTVESLDPATLPLARAPALVRSMPGPQACADPASLEDASLPEDPTLREMAHGVGEASASVRTLANGGRYSEANAVATASLAAAEPLGDVAIVLQLRIELANVLLASGETDGTRELLESVYWAAESGGHDRLATEAAAMILHAIARAPGPETERWIAFARAASERTAESHPLSRAMFLGGLGAVRFAERRVAEATEAFAEEVELLEQIDGPPMLLVTTKQNLAAMLMSMGRIDEGEALCREVIAAFDAGLGPHHPELANPLLNLSNTLSDHRQDYEGAIAAARRAHEILVEAHGPDAPPSINAQLTLGEAQVDGARCDDGIVTMRDAIARVIGDERHWVSLVIARAGLARCLHQAGHTEDAHAELVLAERVIPSEPGDLISIFRARSKVANAYEALGDLDAAIRSFDAGRKLAFTSPGASVVLAYGASMGELLVRLGRWKEAAHALEEAMPYLDTLATPIERGMHRILLGEALWQLGHDRVRAVAIVRAGRAIAGLGDAERAFFDIWLAAHPDPAR